jgi:sterol-4alpha-carboxylate 3-dehydrogenase (decarboxylating)
VRRGEHKVQIGDNQGVFEVVEVSKAAEAHILAAKALLRSDNRPATVRKVNGEALEASFISNGHAIPYWDFFRKCYAAAGAPVNSEKIRVIPLRVTQIIASIVEWFLLSSLWVTRRQRCNDRTWPISSGDAIGGLRRRKSD